jgi:uncharacterized protein
MDVPSPCISVCKLDRDNVCIGCGRHIDEVIAWPSAGNEEKQRIVAAARERLLRMQRLPAGVRL